MHPRRHCTSRAPRETRFRGFTGRIYSSVSQQSQSRSPGVVSNRRAATRRIVHIVVILAERISPGNWSEPRPSRSAQPWTGTPRKRLMVERLEWNRDWFSHGTLNYPTSEAAFRFRVIELSSWRRRSPLSAFYFSRARSDLSSFPGPRARMIQAEIESASRREEGPFVVACTSRRHDAPCSRVPFDADG